MPQWTPKKGRVILHIDMNAFYCSVHASHEPQRYRGKPIAVGGNVEERRGILVTASYECRAKGVKTGMPIWEARKLCPEMIVISPDFELYRRYSREMMQILYRYTPLVEQASIDEAYLDITGCESMGSPLDISTSIQQQIKSVLGLPCSIGIAPNKFLAKMASDMKKPNGITILRKRDVKEKLWPMPAGNLHGVGKKTTAKLQKLKIHTIGELAAAPVDLLRREFGKAGVLHQEHANGNDRAIVDPYAMEEVKSIGNSTTLPRDVDELETLKQVLMQLAESVSRRLNKREMLAESLQITIRYADWRTITRSLTIITPFDAAQDIFDYASALFDKHWSGEPVRLLGISTNKLIERSKAYIQLDIFTFDQEENKR